MTKVNVTHDSLKEASQAVIDAYCFQHLLVLPPDFRDAVEAVCEGIIQTLLKKNHDYGDAWQRYGMFTGLIRLNDKLLRIQTLADGKPAMVEDEGIETTLVDVVGYGLLLAVWMRGQGVGEELKLGEELKEDIARATDNFGDAIKASQLYIPFGVDNITKEEQVLKDIASKPPEAKKIYIDDVQWHSDDKGVYYIPESDSNKD